MSSAIHRRPREARLRDIVFAPRPISEFGAQHEFFLLCLAAVSAASGVSPADIRSPRRGRAPVARARHLAIYLQHVVFGASLSCCGKSFARDRTSVRHACAKIEDERDEPAFDCAVARLEDALLAQHAMLIEFSGFF
ncbi:MAG: chromosomal replication initiator DnaA [Methylocystaceae bacterium]|nr:MAG: chromosomal replication initiator DnaA [Methylocystaceae bacterium]